MEKLVHFYILAFNDADYMVNDNMFYNRLQKRSLVYSMNKEKKTAKIAFIINTLSNGGAERTISNITTNLPDEYEADIIVNDAEGTTYPFKGNLISLGL